VDEACALPVLGKMCQTVGQDTAQLVTAPFDWLAQVLAQAAGWLFTQMWSVLDSTTLVELAKPGYVSVYNLIFGLAIVLMLIFFCLQLLTGLIHRDPGALTRAVVGLGKSVLGSFVVVTLTATLLEVTDKLSVGIVQATGQTMAGMGDRVASLTEALSGFVTSKPGIAVILTIILAGLAVAAALVVWFSLLIRKALLLVAVVFAPIALAGLSWDATRGWFGRWASFVIALSCSKLVLVVVFLVAVNQTDAPIDKGLASVSEPIAGIALLLVAAFAPYLAYKFISFIGFDISHAMASEQEAKTALTHTMPTSVGAPLARRARAILGGSGGDVAARAAMAGGPMGAGVTLAGNSISTVADQGPRAGRQLADTASDHTGEATRGQAQPPEHSSPQLGPTEGPGSSNPWLTARPPQASEQIPPASGSSPEPRPSNPWLTARPQQPPIVEPTPPEPVSATDPET
jgi:type IV secretion system protein TrbL